jgi:hypothetical protein
MLVMVPDMLAATDELRRICIAIVNDLPIVAAPIFQCGLNLMAGSVYTHLAS